jgi:hypothetical protein
MPVEVSPAIRNKVPGQYVLDSQNVFTGGGNHDWSVAAGLLDEQETLSTRCLHEAAASLPILWDWEGQTLEMDG